MKLKKVESLSVEEKTTISEEIERKSTIDALLLDEEKTIPVESKQDKCPDEMTESEVQQNLSVEEQKEDQDDIIENFVVVEKEDAIITEESLVEQKKEPS